MHQTGQGRMSDYAVTQSEETLVVTVSVVVPYHPEREQNGQLARAVDSVKAQKRQPDELILEPDPERTGAAATRNRALQRVTTDFVAWLDSDDMLLPNHIRGLCKTQETYKADIVYSAWEGINTRMFDPALFVTQWSPIHEKLQLAGNFMPITTLIRTQAMLDVGGFQEAQIGNGEDAQMYRKLIYAGCVFACHPAVTWLWPPNTSHTSGLGSR
jgi:hypothetical protein